VDSLTQLRLTRELIDIDSTTGREAEAGAFIARTLESLGWRVTCQPVVGDRFNVIASVGDPGVVFSTHYDCVPPFFSSRLDDTPAAPGPTNGAPGLQAPRGPRLYGRGACDAKGILMAQVAAAERLRADGETRVGLLFVVGEERGSEGAVTANATPPPGVRFLINGEPTDNRLGLATRGVYRARLRAAGRAAHSSLPELGVSAIDKLVDAIVALRQVAWPVDPELGATFYSVGVIKGGVAPNVISPEAEAEVMFRSIGPHKDLRRLLLEHVGSLVSVEDVLVVPPVRLATVPGIDRAVFAFTTDIPFLDRWGSPLLIGPGSITHAHTAEERCDVAELERAVDLYADIARHLLDLSAG
jgi:acetylornithine deacetylase